MGRLPLDLQPHLVHGLTLTAVDSILVRRLEHLGHEGVGHGEQCRIVQRGRWGGLLLHPRLDLRRRGQREIEAGVIRRSKGSWTCSC